MAVSPSHSFLFSRGLSGTYSSQEIDFVDTELIVLLNSFGVDGRRETQSRGEKIVENSDQDSIQLAQTAWRGELDPIRPSMSWQQILNSRLPVLSDSANFCLPRRPRFCSAKQSKIQRPKTRAKRRSQPLQKRTTYSATSHPPPSDLPPPFPSSPAISTSDTLSKSD